MGNTDEKGYSPQVVSIFSGCGGLDLGFHLEGYETIWANDFAEWAVKSFEKNFGKVIHLKDITKINPYTDKTIPKCDIVLGGFPCQDFSIIWKQPGLNGTRGGLFRHFAEFVDAKNPKAFVAENVKGLITANKGKAIETIIKDFESIAPGYVVKPHLYNFAEYGVPQFRERILFVGVRIDTGFNFNHPLPTHGPNGKLLSNYPPMKTKCRTFSDMFYSMVPKSTELDIAVGYITSDSLMELQRIVELNTLKALNLTIGMHYLERFTKVEYNAALKLNDFLTENKCGEVRLVTPFRYHGKLYSYSDEQGAFAGIIGSNNLSSIVEGGTRVYESAVFLDDKNMACQINNFIRELVQTSTGNIRDLHIDNFREVNPLLEGHEFVKRVDPHEVAEVSIWK